MISLPFLNPENWEKYFKTKQDWKLKPCTS
jgi:hypothetical protein